MTTTRLDKEFQDMVNDQIIVTVTNNILNEVLDWMAKNLEPEDVFRDDQLDTWADAHGYQKVQ